MSYTPAPGTTAYRVLSYLQTLPAGAEVMTSKIADALGLPPNNVAPWLDAALKAGAIYRRQRDDHVRSPFWWSLVDHRKDSGTADLESAADGSQKPNGVRPERPAKAGSDTPQEGANRVQQVLKAEPARADATDREARSKVMAAQGSGSPTARGDNVAPASGAAPAFLQRRGPVTGAQVDGCRAPECHAGACSGRAQQDQPSLPASPLRIALWDDGVLELYRAGDGLHVMLNTDETRQLLGYLDRLRGDAA